jgi:hypothetical protein
MRRAAFLVGALLVTLGTFATWQSPKASALSGANWQAGNIISDPVFTDSNSMTVQQIQAFITNQVNASGGCDTAGTKPATDWGRSDLTHAQFATQVKGWAGPPYVCLNQYNEVPKTTPSAGVPDNSYNHYDASSKTLQPVPGSVSAAQLIYNAAQQYQISPKILLIKIQTESAGPLTQDTWPLQSQYTYAMGSHCPDSGPGGSAQCDSTYAGFSIQVASAAQLLRYYLDNMQQPWWTYKVPYATNSILWNVAPSGCGAGNVYINSKATAALYTYTPYQPNSAALANLSDSSSGGLGNGCSAYGNRNFWWWYSHWFGSPTSPVATTCDSRVKDIVCVWSVRESDGSQFLTSSKSELDNVVYGYGWTNEGIDFYASATQSSGTVPVYRLRHNSKYVYTTDQSEYTTLKATSGWMDEGIPFYTYPSTASTNISHTVYRLYNSTLDQYYLTTDTNLETSLLSGGYTLQSNSFNSFSGLADLPAPATGRLNIYQVRSPANNFYTTSLPELETMILYGYSYGGVVTTSPSSTTGTPVYRLRFGLRYFYTTDASEKDNAVSKYGYTYEGVAFYLDPTSGQVYRLDNTQNGSYYYTGNVNEALLLSNSSYGWVYGGALTSDTSTQSPVFRFLNPLSGKHFFTIDIGEAMRISNKGWQYETIAFSASKDTGMPVYRLLLRDKHFYTTDVNEKNIAVSKYGYIYEGIGFYVSQTTTSTPVYRLQGGSGEYFYTASSAERDTAVSRYGYAYEGEGFYLAP